jgi:dihydrodipicolinate synthase/N-acetylneuraminate lyase
MIHGSLVPNITFFDGAGKLDLELTRWHMRWMLEKGVNGLFLTGSYGSGPLMTKEERLQVFQAAKEIADQFPNRVIIPHVGCIDNRNTIDLGVAADEIGAYALGAVPPFYYKHNEKAIFNFYKDVIESVRTPVFGYNNPETSRFTFNLGLVQKLQEVGLAGIKDSPLEVGFVSSVYYDAKINNKNFEFIIGTSKGWLPFYYMGIRSMIAGMNNYAPEIITALVEATFSGETTRAEKVYMVMMELSKKMHFTDSTIASHVGLYARGFYAGFPRKPMILPSFEEPIYNDIKSELITAFEKLELPLELGDWQPAVLETMYDQ